MSLDPSSRTSAVLTRLLLERVYGLEPEYREGSAESDARLVIGDPALKTRLQGQVVLDLAAEWKSWTGYPFVFAFWAVRREAWREDLPEIFAREHRRGIENFDSMVAEEVAQIGNDGALSRAMIEDYLRHSLHYELTRADEEGLALFYRLAADEGALGPATVVP